MWIVHYKIAVLFFYIMWLHHVYYPVHLLCILIADVLVSMGTTCNKDGVSQSLLLTESYVCMYTQFLVIVLYKGAIITCR